jgi:hypothetical protein
MRIHVADIPHPNDPDYIVTINRITGPHAGQQNRESDGYEVTYPRPDLKGGRGNAGNSGSLSGALVIAASHFNEHDKKTGFTMALHDVSCVFRIFGIE